MALDDDDKKFIDEQNRRYDPRSNNDWAHAVGAFIVIAIFLFGGIALGIQWLMERF